MKYNTKQTLKIYWQHTKKYKWIFFVTVFSIVVIRLLDALVPIYLKNFINVLSLGGDKNLLIPQLFRILIIIAVISFSNWVLWRVATFLASVLESRVIFDLSNYCFNYLHRHSFAFFNNNFIGSLVKRVNRFTRSYETMTDRFVFNFLQLFVEVGVIAVILFFTNRWLGVAMLGWAVFFCSVSLIFVRYKLKYDLERSEADTKATGFLADTFTNNANVKLFNGYQREVNGMSKLNDNVRRLRLFTWNLNNIFEATQGALSVCLEIGMLYLGIKLWQKGLITPGDFILIQTYVWSMMLRVWDFGRNVQHVYEDFADSEEMTEMLTQPHEIVDVPRAKKLVVRDGKIVFEKVSFYYHRARMIFKDFNLIVKPKEPVQQNLQNVLTIYNAQTMGEPVLGYYKIKFDVSRISLKDLEANLRILNQTLPIPVISANYQLDFRLFSLIFQNNYAFASP